MESGIPDDQNFYSRRPHSQTQVRSPSSDFQYQYSPEQNQHHHRQISPPSLELPYLSPRTFDYTPSSPPHPPKLPLLTTSNLEAITTNGFIDASIGGGEPDDFYRGYRAVQQPEQPSTHAFSSQTDDMIAKNLEARPNPSLGRSNTTGAPSKHPNTSNTRTALKPSTFGSNLSTQDSKQKQPVAKPQLNGYSKTPQQPSVKDLLKRFDQNNDQSLPLPRKPTGRAGGGASSGYMRDRSNQYTPRTASNPGPTTTSSHLRSVSGTREAGQARVKSPTSSAKTTQRTKFYAENQHSNNALSSTPRAARAKNSLSGRAGHASRSMSNLGPTVQTSILPPPIPEKRPLFGEVFTFDPSALDAGYGIPKATRRTSDSNLPPMISTQVPAQNHISPTSPTAWYLGVTPSLGDVAPNKPRRSGHNRAHSDFADTKVNTMHNLNRSSFLLPESPVAAKEPEAEDTLGNQSYTELSTKSSSRLPVALKRLSNASDTSSSPSTRASSPLAGKKASRSRYPKGDQRPWSPAGRTATPVNRSNTPTSNSSNTRNKAAGSVQKSSSNSGSLKAYISAPPAKNSPPLRSSRPRQPVSAASTASSRQRAVERSSSPHDARSGMKVTRPGAKADPKSRKITDTGPVDFAARRARITRAYTKSIHETEQQKIRSENLRLLQDRSTRENGSATNEASNTSKETGGASSREADADVPPPVPEPLQIVTSFEAPVPAVPIERETPIDQDSPTLGLTMGLPSKFTDEGAPMSAISTVSATTFIENEEQTEAARMARMPSLKLSPPNSSLTQAVEADYDVDNQTHAVTDSRRISLEATPIEDVQQHTPTLVSGFANPTPANAAEEELPPLVYEPPIAISIEEPSISDSVVDEIFHQDSVEVEEDDYRDQATDHHQADLYDVSPRQSMSIPLVIEAEPEQVYKPPMQTRYSYPPDVPKLEVPVLRAALAESPTNDGQEAISTPIDVDYESSEDVGGGNTSEQEDLYGPAYDQNREVYLSSDSYRRESRHSAWTDYSIATTEDSSAQDDNQKYRYTETTFAESERRPTPPAKLPPSPPHLPVHTGEKFSIDLPELAPLTSHNGFGLGFDPDTVYSVPTVPYWTSETPPPTSEQTTHLDVTSIPPPTRTPPPPSASEDRPSSSIYQSSQNDTNGQTESRRASDDIYSPRPSLSTPRSSTQISQEDVSLPQGSGIPPVPQLPPSTQEDKDAKDKSQRLFTRRKIIEEIIDTEAVYLKDMNVVEEIYKGTAEACPKLDGFDIKTIFRNCDELIAFSSKLLDDLKAAGAAVYTTKARVRQSRATGSTSGTATAANTPISTGPENSNSSAPAELNDVIEEKDRKTFIGHAFGKHLQEMQTLYTDFLKNSELASNRLKVLEKDPAVKVWLVECNLVAKDLTAAWDLDALLVKPVQRITRYQLLLQSLFKHTPEDHPDYQALQSALRELLDLLKNIDDLKKRIHMVGKIVGRKRKESEVRTGLAKAFGRRSDKLQSDAVRPHDDEVYAKLHDKFGHDYLRLQVVLRDVEYYTRQVATYVSDFLRYLSAMELVMRMSPSAHPEIESRWSQFSLSMRDMGSVALESHVNDIRQRVIGPFESVIHAYSPPTLAMKKRAKRRVDYEKFLVNKAAGKKIDEKLEELVSQYEALNETLKMELPKLSALTEKIGRICLGNLVDIQTTWYRTWQEKVKTVLDANQMPKDTMDIVHTFNRDYKYVEARAQELCIINGTFKEGGNWSAATSMLEPDNPDSISISSARDNSKGRRSESSYRSRGLSVATADKSHSPSLPTPEFAKRHSGQFSFSPILANAPGLPHAPYQPAAYSNGYSLGGTATPASPEHGGSRVYSSARPHTSRSIASDNGGIPRISTDLAHRRESSSTQASASYLVDGPIRERAERPFSGIFHSAMPLPDGPEDSARSSRASSHERPRGSRYNVIYLAASLFEFNIAATKTEAGYPYLTYSAGEIFDVIGEKGELWLAKNQDDDNDRIGWIWSKHFARLAAD
ncbi:Rho guanyl nucleotide exchange factor protein [Rutstroemia sp. NJR-2017a BBW]|nr:Rho guanyl nucleotide exchange factor protein [Rutstroemia sp. NJR-2017a BBW]